MTVVDAVDTFLFGKRRYRVTIALVLVMATAALVTNFQILQAVLSRPMAPSSSSSSHALASGPIPETPRVLSHEITPQLRTASNVKKRPSSQQSTLVVDPAKHKLDFFIAGFPKCGTTTLLYAFGDHNETAMSAREHCSIAQPSVADSVAHSKLTAELNELAPAGQEHVKRGIKCPRGLYNSRSLERLQQFSPDVKIIIGLRHPLEVFQSYYNYRVTEIHDKQLDDAIPPLETLVGKNEWKGVSTLVRCDIVNKGIEDSEGLKVMTSLLDAYKSDDEYSNVKTFNKKPQSFDVDDYISVQNQKWTEEPVECV